MVSAQSKANHKSVVCVLPENQAQIFTNCCILFEIQYLSKSSKNSPLYLRSTVLAFSENGAKRSVSLALHCVSIFRKQCKNGQSISFRSVVHFVFKFLLNHYTPVHHRA